MGNHDPYSDRLRRPSLSMTHTPLTKKTQTRRMTACGCKGICRNTSVRLGYKCEPGLLTTPQVVR